MLELRFLDNLIPILKFDKNFLTHTLTLQYIAQQGSWEADGSEINPAGRDSRPLPSTQ